MKGLQSTFLPLLLACLYLNSPGYEGIGDQLTNNVRNILYDYIDVIPLNEELSIKEFTSEVADKSTDVICKRILHSPTPSGLLPPAHAPAQPPCAACKAPPCPLHACPSCHGLHGLGLHGLHGLHGLGLHGLHGLHGLGLHGLHGLHGLGLHGLHRPHGLYGPHPHHYPRPLILPLPILPPHHYGHAPAGLPYGHAPAGLPYGHAPAGHHPAPVKPVVHLKIKIPRLPKPTPKPAPAYKPAYSHYYQQYHH